MVFILMYLQWVMMVTVKIYCENGSSIEFKLFKKSTAELIDLVGEIPNWENQKI